MVDPAWAEEVRGRHLAKLSGFALALVLWGLSSIPVSAAGVGLFLGGLEVGGWYALGGTLTLLVAGMYSVVGLALVALGIAWLSVSGRNGLVRLHAGRQTLRIERIAVGASLQSADHWLEREGVWSETPAAPPEEIDLASVRVVQREEQLVFVGPQDAPLARLDLGDLTPGERDQLIGWVSELRDGAARTLGELDHVALAQVRSIVGARVTG